MDEQTVIDEIRNKVITRPQKTVAAELNISTAYLSRLLSGQRPVTAEIAKRLGYRQVVSYEKVAVRDASASEAGAE